MMNSPESPHQSKAATFVDYDNLHTILDEQSGGEDRPEAFAREILSEVRRYLSEGDNTPTILGRAYADFGGLPTANDASIQEALHRIGVEPVVTPTGFQGNTSELQLCIDVMDLLGSRSPVHTVVIVTGNRPYLPLVRRIRENGYRALVAAVNPPVTDASTQYVEDDVYLDARNLLSQSLRDTLLDNAPADEQPRAVRSDAPQNGSASTPTFRSLDDALLRRTVEITEEHFGQYEEVYLTPLLRKLSDILGDDYDPKSLVSDLEAAGAVRLEKRDGYPYDYTVLIVNEDHPDIQEIQDDFYSRSSGYGLNEGYSDESSETNGASDAYDDTDADLPSYEDYDEVDDAPETDAAETDAAETDAAETDEADAASDVSSSWDDEDEWDEQEDKVV